MYAIEFETQIHDGVVKIPAQYTRAKNGRARIVVLLDEDGAKVAEMQPQEQAISFSDCGIDAFQQVDGVAWQREQRDTW
ncbi:MAG: hypothetical protein ACQEUM_15335 [Pseudomonadota bacterium]